MKNESVKLERTGKADLTFNGNELAFSSSNPKGNKIRWTELKIFQTTAGRYVVQVLGLSKADGEVTRSTVTPVDDLDNLPDVLGFGTLAKQIYKKLSLSFSERL